MLSFLAKKSDDVHFEDTHFTADESCNWDGENPGMLETYDEHIEKARHIRDTDYRRLWTIIDSDDGDAMLIVPGWRVCNRCAFFVTNERWEDKGAEYVWVAFEKESLWSRFAAWLKNWLVEEEPYYG